MKRILFVRANNTSPRVEKEANSLAKAGYAVNLFLWNRKSSTPTYKFESECNICECTHKAPFGKYVIFHWIFWWCAVFKYLLKNDFDIVHVCGLDSYPPAILAKFIKQYIIIYDIFDFMGESLPIGTPHFIEKFVCDLERYLIRFADAVIIVDESRKIQIEGVKISKLEIVMNCVSDKYYLDNYEKSSVDFTVFYGGMLSKNRGLNQIIDVIKNNQDIKLVVAGSGENEGEFESIFGSYSNIEFLGQISHDEAIKLTYQSNAVFGFYNPMIPINRLASPNKLFEAMMCRTPIIINEETSMAEIVRKENCGMIIPYEDGFALKKAILKLKNDPEMCKKMGENGRSAFEREYNWEIMESRLLHIYSGLDGGCG